MADGVAIVDPHRLPRNDLPPPVRIEALRRDDRPLPMVAPIRLQAGTGRVEFRYTALSLTAPDRVRFRYRLEGYDAGWRGPLAAREVSYTHLPHGDYRFRVQACNNDGVWNEAGATLAFAILPNFWETPAFTGLVAACAAGLLLVAYRWRIRRVASALDRRFQERLSERMRVAHDLHDTLLQGMLSASMQLHVAVAELPDSQRGSTRLVRVAGLLNEVIAAARNAVSRFRSEDTGASDLAEVLSQVHAGFDAPNGPSFRAVTSGAIRELRAGVRDEVLSIAREAVLNGLRHAQATAIEVTMEYSPKTFRMLVADNGRGIASNVLDSRPQGHWGLTGMRERADRLGARLVLRSREGAGTEVELTVSGSIAYVAQQTIGPFALWTRWVRARAEALGLPRAKR
jgi:signal transduction histidine kinase